MRKNRPQSASLGCVNSKQLETICVNFLRSLEVTKITGNGHLCFVSLQFMAKVDIFEDFIEMVSQGKP